MQLPLQITFRDIGPSPAVEAAIRERAARLDRFHPHITGCHVTVEGGHRHHHKGHLYKVKISVTIPGGEIVATHAHPRDHAHEDVYVAIRDAFDAVTRQLEDRVRIKHGQVKSHAAPLHGKVVRLFPDHGFIEAADAGEVYFHKNSVVDQAFERLEVGSEVIVAIAEGESPNGWQASTVRPVGKHHPVAW